MTIGESIRYHRKRLNLTQAQLAERLNVTAQAVSRWENDTCLPDISMAVPLARALGTTTDELLRFGEHYQEFETRWAQTLRQYGDNPMKLLPVALDAIKEFRYDRIFLFRVSVCYEQLAESTSDYDQSKFYLSQALVHFRLYYEMSPDHPRAISSYRALKEKSIVDEQGEYVLKSRYQKQ
jgi:transcriptional regulator with XRE-family HTH domain